MHAASVHPEPGSNSRKYCIKSPCGVSILSSSFCSSFTFVWVVFSFRIDRDFSSHFLFALYLSLVVQFSMTGCRPKFPSFWRLDYYITSFRLCQVLFQKFFQLFSGFFQPLSVHSLEVSLADSFHILSLSSSFVNPFFETFFFLSLFYPFIPLYSASFVSFAQGLKFCSKYRNKPLVFGQ